MGWLCESMVVGALVCMASYGGVLVWSSAWDTYKHFISISGQ